MMKEGSPDLYLEQEITMSPYLLTWDIPLLVKELCQSQNWEQPEEKTFNEARRLLQEELSRCYPNNPIIILTFAEIQQKIANLTEETRREQLLPIISLDPIYGKGLTEYRLEPTRVISNSGEIIGQGARPGTPALEEQIFLLKKNLGDENKVILLDVGAFEGKSLIRLREMMKDSDIETAGVILGIATEEAQQNLLSNGLISKIAIFIKKPIDWIEARDFVPFVPLSGRVVQDNQAGIISRAIPYLLPEGDPVNWAEIPPERAVALSLLGWQISEIIIEDIEMKNDLELTIEDLTNSPLRISYPGYEMTFNGKTKLRSVIASKIAFIGK